MPPIESGIATEWEIPIPVEYTDTRAAANLGWRDFMADSKLIELTEFALKNNRDMRIALLNVDRARAQYGIQRADQLPTINAALTGNRGGGENPQINENYTSQLGIANFELDIFGRLRNLSAGALQAYLATEDAKRSTQILLISEVAKAYLTLAANIERKRIATATEENLSVIYELMLQRHRLGAASEIDVQQARSILENARADSARLTGVVTQDRNALTLLVGGKVDATLQPINFEPWANSITPLPAGLPSEVLLQRPDILQAEHALRAANANIGAARAAFFPRLSLTGAMGSASRELSGLFDSNTSYWNFMPQLTLPIFQAGRLKAGLGVAKANRDIVLASYEKSIQTGFREVADALALSQTLIKQRATQEAIVKAATNVLTLAAARYESGQDSYIVLLDAQRALYSARQSLVETQLAEQLNRVTLYKVLGGGLK